MRLQVTLTGWIQHMRMDKFVLLRDKSGIIQLVFDVDKFSAPFESCLSIEGTVLARPADMVNSKLTTGEVEVHVDKINCLNAAIPQLPFYIKPYNTAKESLRLKHRYLDLRHPWLQNNLKIRSDLMLKMRTFLQDQGFLDIETPTLFRRTPGGAQEFVVPSHVEEHFYSLVQSPQQFKQLLMVGGVEKYYQIARYYILQSQRIIKISLLFIGVTGMKEVGQTVNQNSLKLTLNYHLQLQLKFSV